MKLSSQALERVRTCMNLIQQHQTTLEALNTQIRNTIWKDTGADIEAESWELDPDTGELTQPIPTTIEEVEDE